VGGGKWCVGGLWVVVSDVWVVVGGVWVKASHLSAICLPMGSMFSLHMGGTDMHLLCQIAIILLKDPTINISYSYTKA
jgi:hypothetical protein